MKLWVSFRGHGPVKQVNDFNKKAGYDKYEYEFIDKVPSGSNARETVYKLEKAKAKELRDQKLIHKDIHQQP